MARAPELDHGGLEGDPRARRGLLVNHREHAALERFMGLPRAAHRFQFDAAFDEARELGRREVRQA